ncbi:MAG: type II toxin-antitoxin system RelE/ParE family toxin [Spirulina sp.]
MTELEIPQEYAIELTPLALKMLENIKDLRHREGIGKRIERLKSEPEKQGKALKDVLKGYRSIRAIGQRYRIIYAIEQERIVVLVIGIGLRREGDRSDIYATIERWLESDRD